MVKPVTEAKGASKASKPETPPAPEAAATPETLAATDGTPATSSVTAARPSAATPAEGELPFAKVLAAKSAPASAVAGTVTVAALKGDKTKDDKSAAPADTPSENPKNPETVLPGLKASSNVSDTGSRSPAQVAEVVATKESFVKPAEPKSAVTPVTDHKPAVEKPVIEKRAEEKRREPETLTQAKPYAAVSSPTPVTPAPVVRRGPGFFPLLLGGVAAALAGAGGTIYALPHLPPQLAGLLPAVTAPADTSALETALTEGRARVDSLATEVNALKTAAPPAPDLSGVKGVMDEVAASNRSLQETLTALATRVEALEQRPAALTTNADGTVVAAPDSGQLAALQSQINTLREQIAAATSSGAATQEQIAAAANTARSEIAAAQAESERLRNETAAATQRSLAQAAVARVSAAFESGAPMAGPIGAAEAAGLSVPAALKGNVPSLTSLQVAFPQAAREALKASRKAAAGETLGERLGAFLMAQTGARSVEPRAGDDPDAVLSRASAAVNAGDIPVALTEIGALPQAGQALMSGWVTTAQQRVVAAQALLDLAKSVN